MDFRGVRPAVGGGDLDQQVFRSILGVFDKDVEIAILIENTGIEQFVFHLLAVAPGVGLDQIFVWIGGLRVLVQVLHVRVGWRAVEVEVVLLHILAVVALTVGQAKQPFLEDRVLTIPQGQCEAQVLLIIRNPSQTILAPAVGT